MFYVDNNRKRDSLFPIIKNMYILIIDIYKIIEILMTIFILLEYFLIAFKHIKFKILTIEGINFIKWIIVYGLGKAIFILIQSKENGVELKD